MVFRRSGREIRISFQKNLPTPRFFNIRFSFKDSLKSLKPQFLPTSVVNPIQMNLVFVGPICTCYGTCKGDFDKLLFLSVALRPMCTIKTVSHEGRRFRRCRQSFHELPFMFKPIEIDNVLKYDGRWRYL